MPSSRRPLLIGPSCMGSWTASTFIRAVTHSTRTFRILFYVMNRKVIECNTTLSQQFLNAVTAKRHLLRLLTVSHQSRHWKKHSTKSPAWINFSWEKSLQSIPWVSSRVSRPPVLSQKPVRKRLYTLSGYCRWLISGGLMQLMQM